MYIEGLDQVDNQILTILEKNARASYSDIAKEVGLSRVAVKNHIENMEEKGIIRGYKVIVDGEKAVNGEKFYLDIITEPDYFTQTVETLEKYGIVRKIYAVTGESRIRAEGFALSSMRYEMFLKSMRRQLEGIKVFTVTNILYTLKDADGGIKYEYESKQQDSGEREEGKHL